MSKDKRSKFEKDLKVYFPELSDIYGLMKEDSKVWTAIKEMGNMNKSREFGNLKIGYQDGKINRVHKTTSVKD